MTTRHNPAPTLAGRIFDDLSRRILAGELAAGARLRQDEIAAAFGASHVPVREALRRLEAEGLAESLPRRGVRVATVSREALYEIVEMRAELEALALRHAAGHFPAEHLAALTRADLACSEALSQEDWQAANRAFHRLLIEHCPMPRLMETIERLQASAGRMTRMLDSRRPLPLPREDRDHKAIVAALQARDADLAAAHLARHIRRGYRLSTNYR